MLSSLVPSKYIAPVQGGRRETKQAKSAREPYTFCCLDSYEGHGRRGYTLSYHRIIGKKEKEKEVLIRPYLVHDLLCNAKGLVIKIGAHFFYLEYNRRNDI